jgi:hypothetical protein
MSKSKYKIDERVAFFNNGTRCVGIICSFDEDTRQYSITVGVELAKYRHYPIHERQICRLKPRKPLRTFWLNLHDDKYPNEIYESKEEADKFAFPGRLECIEVQEVRRKK